MSEGRRRVMGWAYRAVRGLHAWRVRGSTPMALVHLYRGYHAAGRIWLAGHVRERMSRLDEPISPSSAAESEQSRWENVREMYQRYAAAVVAGARVRVTCGDNSWELETDENGAFEVEAAASLPHSADGWVPARAGLLDSPPRFGRPSGEAFAEVRCLEPDVDTVVVSDIDDTLLETGAGSLRSMTRRVVLQSARTRTAVPGMPAFLRRQLAGSDVPPPRQRPLFFVSSAAWNLYGMLVDAFDNLRLPRGVFLLRELGVRPDQFLAHGHHHKADKIRRLLATLPGVRLILIGDTGQQDPEIYASLASDFPDRLHAVYLRAFGKAEQIARAEACGEASRARGIPWQILHDADLTNL